jgi:hypothetical protein
MKRIHAMLEDENYVVLDQHKKRWGFKSIDDALNDLLKNYKEMK